MKKLLCILLCMVTVLSMSGMAFAQESEEPETIISEVFEFTGPGILDVMEYPKEYQKEEAEHQGRVERIDYNNGYGNKYMFVYLPYGYDDNEELYNTYYLIHGGNGRPDVFLQDEHPTMTQKVFDHAFEAGEMKPFIIVSSSWNPATDEEGNEITDIEGYGENLTLEYVDELVNYIIPLVDGNYRTYAQGTDEESLKAARDHRAFGGFSMGGVTTWNVFMNAMAYFTNFVPESGDCWAVENTGGSTHAQETAQALADAAQAQGYGPEDFNIYAFTGTQDIAMPNLGPQILAMQENEFFQFGDHVFFGALEGGEHNESAGRRYRYTAAHYLWQE